MHRRHRCEALLDALTDALAHHDLLAGRDALGTLLDQLEDHLGASDLQLPARSGDLQQGPVHVGPIHGFLAVRTATELELSLADGNSFEATRLRIRIVRGASGEPYWKLAPDGATATIEGRAPVLTVTPQLLPRLLLRGARAVAPIVSVFYRRPPVDCNPSDLRQALLALRRGTRRPFVDLVVQADIRPQSVFEGHGPTGPGWIAEDLEIRWALGGTVIPGARLDPSSRARSDLWVRLLRTSDVEDLLRSRWWQPWRWRRSFKIVHHEDHVVLVLRSALRSACLAALDATYEVSSLAPWWTVMVEEMRAISYKAGGLSAIQEEVLRILLDLQQSYHDDDVPDAMRAVVAAIEGLPIGRWAEGGLGVVRVGNELRIEVDRFEDKTDAAELIFIGTPLRCAETPWVLTLLDMLAMEPANG